MDINTIKELSKLLKEQQLTALEFDDGASRIRLECMSAPKGGAPLPPVNASAPLFSQMGNEAFSKATDPGMDFNEMKTVASPLVGVFYAAPAPDQPPFVQVGDVVKKGDILCIVEAMKVMNEITAESGGQIVDICVQNGDVVEFGQTLFKLV
ncbi:acetyl-CoA carboxylase biotin carboxyl carrier protein [Christensenellaceae bacterium OttesenSCG-928-M15]|nr:acetyl-CoA carboxylase biotin carboxyl carrier protein [Christensenellaceae bacterium OttesenSCG-928-M15]